MKTRKDSHCDRDVEWHRILFAEQTDALFQIFMTHDHFNAKLCIFIIGSKASCNHERIIRRNIFIGKRAKERELSLSLNTATEHERLHLTR
jgi:hypothetical protein